MSDKKKYKRPELPLPFRPLQVSPPALTSLPPRQPAKDFYLLCFIFYFSLSFLFLIFLKGIMIIKRVLQTPWWALAGLWCSQVQPSFLLWQHRCKNICQCLHFQTIFAFAGIWSLFFSGSRKREKSHAGLQGSYCWPIVLQYTNGAFERCKVL